MANSVDRNRLVEELCGLENEVKELVASFSPIQLNWQPEAGRGWSVAQCIDHLARSNSIYLPALSEAAERAPEASNARQRELRPNLLGRWFLRWLEPPARLKTKAPLAEMQPPSTHDPSRLVEEFVRLQRKVVELVRTSGEKDVSAVRFRNPMVKGRRPFNLATGLLVIAAHERRHLWQAGRVVERPDFPR